LCSILRGETSIAELCRRERIAESMYYSWSKEFLEAGKRRPAQDTARAATTNEVKQLRTAGGVDEMNLEQGRAILDEIQAWATQPQFVYRH
jgi:transposase-like protein